MGSTFMGLEASKRGLFVQQSALYTTGHNISNANTDGYTRQRVNMQATAGFPYPGLNSPQYPGHMGTGVEASSVTRIRDEFIDRQYRQESNKLGYWDSTLSSINQMEDILSEPSEYGINQAFTDFWKSFQDLSTQPDDSAARKVAIAKAESLAEAFNYNYTQLETIQGNLGNEIDVSTQQVNTILEKIAMINSQVAALEPNGYVTNDLYDARDLLIDELNEYLPVTIERVPSGGRASEEAEGTIIVKYNGIELVNGNESATISVEHQTGQINSSVNANGSYDLFKKMTITKIDGSTEDVDYATMSANHASRGKMLALIDAYGYQDANGNRAGLYPEMMDDLDKLASTFVLAFNEVHEKGFTLGDNSTNGVKFFDANGTTAKTMAVDATVVKDPNLIAASTGVGEEGNGRWAMELSNLQYAKISNGTTISANGTTATLTQNLDGFTFQDFYTGLIGDLAVAGDKATTNQYNSETQMITVSNNRSSMSSVSLDEEMTNMITFQQAYNANARMITVIDETLDKIINGMGRVGL